MRDAVYNVRLGEMALTLSLQPNKKKKKKKKKKKRKKNKEESLFFGEGKKKSMERFQS